MTEKNQNDKVQSKRIIKRRLNNFKKQYLVLNNDLYSWKNESQDLKAQIHSYDQSIRNILPYFPVVFEKKNPRVKIILEDNKLKILYNNIEVDQELHLDKKARLQIIQQLQKTFRPQKQFVYADEKDKNEVKLLLKEDTD